LTFDYESDTTATKTVNDAPRTTTTTHALVGGSKLKYLSNGAEIASLVVSQTFDDSDVNYVECIRSHNSRVDVTIVDQIADDLHKDTETDKQTDTN